MDPTDYITGGDEYSPNLLISSGDYYFDIKKSEIFRNLKQKLKAAISGISKQHSLRKVRSGFVNNYFRYPRSPTVRTFNRALN